MKKLLIFITIIIITLISVPILVAGYFGFVPVVSDIMGTNKPRDLGIKATKENYDSGIKKLGVKVAIARALPDQQVLAHEGSHKVEATFTSQEVTAMTQSHHEGYFPLTNAQVKLNPDGSFEVSGVLKIGTAMSYLTQMGVSQKNIDEAFSIAKLPKADLPLYVKGSGEVQNNNVSTSLRDMQVGRFPVPNEIVEQYNGEIDSLLSVILQNDLGATIRTMKAQEGKVYVDGDFPDVETVLGR